MISIMFNDLEPRLTGLIRHKLVYQPGRYLFHRGDPVRRIHFVTAGTVHLVRHLPSGAPLVIQRAGSGDLVAEASLYAAKYHCDAIATTETSIRAFAKRELLVRLADDPVLAAALLKRLAAELQHARFHAEILSLKTVACRLDAWMEWKGTVPAKGEWVRLASELSVSAEALYREMAIRRAKT